MLMDLAQLPLHRPLQGRSFRAHPRRSNEWCLTRLVTNMAHIRTRHTVLVRVTPYFDHLAPQYMHISCHVGHLRGLSPTLVLLFPVDGAFRGWDGDDFGKKPITAEDRCLQIREEYGVYL